MAGRRRLDQVDAMRPLKQVGVVSTHTIITFAPAGAAVLSNATLLLLHVSREVFFFISACMLTYAYAGLQRAGWGTFYWRRFVSVGVPYLCWSLIYFLWFPYVLRDADYADTASSALAHLGHQLYFGYNHLYFLIVIMEFYLLFPLVLWLLRRTKGHHGLRPRGGGGGAVRDVDRDALEAAPRRGGRVRPGERRVLRPLPARRRHRRLPPERRARLGGQERAPGRVPDRGFGRLRRSRVLPVQEGVHRHTRPRQRPVPAQRDPVQRVRDRPRVPGRDVPGAALAVAADQGRGAHRLGQRVRHLPGPDDLHHLAGRARLDDLRGPGALLGVAPADRGDRLLRRHPAHRPAGPHAAGGAADRAQAGTLADPAAAASAGARAAQPVPAARACAWSALAGTTTDQNGT